MIENINWYPGHMKKTREMIEENLKAVDLVIEILDSRIPFSSRNTMIDGLVKGKDRIFILGKADLADPEETGRWVDALGNGRDSAIGMDTRSGDNIRALYRIMEKYSRKREASGKTRRPLRLMVVGVPNVGKSSLINRLTGRNSAKTGNKPGVTRGKQWVTLENGMQLLDTPGILWPKFEDPETGMNLAFCGSIKDEIVDRQDLAYELIKVLRDRYPDRLMKRYGLDHLTDEDEELFDEDGRPIDPAVADMEKIARKRGFILSGGRIDFERTSRTLLDEFRAGKIGRITLERAEDFLHD